MKAHFILVIIFVIYASDYTDRYVVSSLASYIKDDWKISDFEIGALMTVVLFTITAFSIPASILVDRWSLPVAMSFIAFYCLLGALFFYIGSKFYERDLSRVEKIELLEDRKID